MVRTTRIKDIRMAAQEANQKDEPLQIIPSDYGVTLDDLPFIDVWEMNHMMQQWDLIAVHECRDTRWNEPLDFIRTGRWYVKAYDDMWQVVFELEARGAERCREICGCTEDD